MKKLADKIPNKESWIRGNYATDEQGFYVELGNYRACKFCLSGAVQLIENIVPRFGRNYDKLAEIVLDYTKENVKYKGKSTSPKGADHWTIVGFNDTPITTWEDVQEVIARFDAQLKEAV